MKFRTIATATRRRYASSPNMCKKGGRDVQHPDKKKIWHQTVGLLREECMGFGLGTLCGLFGYSRQSYYKRSGNEFAEDGVAVQDDYRHTRGMPFRA